MEFKQDDIIMPASETKKDFREALETVQKLVTGYDPFKGHRPEDAASGKSTFHKSGTSSEMLEWVFEKLDYMSYKKLEVNKATIILVFKTDTEIGTAVTTTLDPESEYEIDTPHGDYLQAKGPVVKHESETKNVTFVVTNEGDSENTAWCLASVYPGLPDVPGDWSGLKAGDKVSGQELINRGITRAHQ